MKAKDRGRIEPVRRPAEGLNQPLILTSGRYPAVTLLELGHKILDFVHQVLERMFRAVTALAIITTICVLSPVRESKNDSDTTRSWPPSSLSASLDVLTGAASKSSAVGLSDSARRETAAALLLPAARESAAAELESVRKIMMPPSPVHVDMPPLRR
jgi:hypothetical protein